MKSKLYFLFPAVLCGMFSQAASAQVIDWGKCDSYALTGTTTSGSAPSTVYGNVAITDANLSSNVTVKGSGKVSTLSSQNINDMFDFINTQLNNIINPNTVALTASGQSSVYNPGRPYVDLGEGSNNNLKPGTYTFNGDVRVPNSLVLDDGGDKYAVYIFKISGQLNVLGNVTMKTGFTGINVYWQVAGNGVELENRMTGNIVNSGPMFLQANATPTGKIFSKGITHFNGATIDNPVDTDGDTINDYADDYPLDKTKAFNNDSRLSPLTIAYEDLWPSKGDYDYNDVVMKTSYNYITNARGFIVQVIATFNLLATGGVQKNAFHIRFTGNNIRLKHLVEGSLTGGIAEQTASGASIKIFSNMREEMVEYNTIPGRPLSPTKLYTVSFNVQPTAGWTIGGKNAIGEDPYIENTYGDSRREIHLAGIDPTSLADMKVFNTKDDSSASETYTTAEGLPWAISFPSDHFDYPKETKDISLAYPHLADFITSPEGNFVDWYSNLSSGYRNNSLIYAAPF